MNRAKRYAYLIDLFLFHQDESLNSWADDKTNRLHLFAGLTDLSLSLPMQSEALILGIIHCELSVTKIGSKR